MGTKGLRQNEIRNHGEVGDELQRVDQLMVGYRCDSKYVEE